MTVLAGPRLRSAGLMIVMWIGKLLTVEDWFRESAEKR